MGFDGVVGTGSIGTGDEVEGALVELVILVLGIHQISGGNGIACANIDRPTASLADTREVHAALVVATLRGHTNRERADRVFRAEQKGNLGCTVLWRKRQQTVESAADDVAANRNASIGQREAGIAKIQAVILAVERCAGDRVAVRCALRPLLR